MISSKILYNKKYFTSKQTEDNRVLYLLSVAVLWSFLIEMRKAGFFVSFLKGKSVYISSETILVFLTC